MSSGRVLLISGARVDAQCTAYGWLAELQAASQPVQHQALWLDDVHAF
jgi:hypothetical protein